MGRAPLEPQARHPPPRRHRSSGSYLDAEGRRHQDDFDVSLLVCHWAAPFEEQGEAERHVLR